MYAWQLYTCGSFSKLGYLLLFDWDRFHQNLNWSSRCMNERTCQITDLCVFKMTKRILSAMFYLAMNAEKKVDVTKMCLSLSCLTTVQMRKQKNNFHNATTSVRFINFHSRTKKKMLQSRRFFKWERKTDSSNCWLCI